MTKTLTLLGLLLTNHVAFSQWSTNSAINNAICTDGNIQNGVQIISDGSGGAIIAWHDNRNGDPIFAQRINSSGNNQWATDGVQLPPATASGERTSITSDGNGGAIITWQAGGDFGSNYAQRVNSAGVIQWGANGVLICAGTARARPPKSPPMAMAGRSSHGMTGATM